MLRVLKLRVLRLQMLRRLAVLRLLGLLLLRILRLPVLLRLAVLRRRLAPTGRRLRHDSGGMVSASGAGVPYLMCRPIATMDTTQIPMTK
ncbi:hypothetical protein MINS_24210 [Mycolicibacterium insubricum]|nr:hypothetical protein MINS_24210 [Mycolicibacterium insubricum]